MGLSHCLLPGILGYIPLSVKSASAMKARVFSSSLDPFLHQGGYKYKGTVYYWGEGYDGKTLTIRITFYFF